MLKTTVSDTTKTVMAGAESVKGFVTKQYASATVVVGELAKRLSTVVTQANDVVTKVVADATEAAQSVLPTKSGDDVVAEEAPAAEPAPKVTKTVKKTAVKKAAPKASDNAV